MCDTFVLKKNGKIFFGKNSDREPNEAQILEYYPGKVFEKGSRLQTTYLEIEQARETFGIIISRPFWMWGAEMGVNEKGVVIGNEAVFTRLPYIKKNVLTGMDILRLTLERAESAESAVETIIKLMEDYGQGGICGFEDKRMSYHNSFLVADRERAFVLETAGKFWIYKEIEDFYSISNRLTIEEDFDEIHPEAIEFARKKRWLKKGETFNFSKVFSDFLFTKFSGSNSRWLRAYNLLKNSYNDFSIKKAFSILRDHGGEDYRPDSHLIADYICAHGGNIITRNATQTVGSLVVVNSENSTDIWATATSAPCTAIFNPVSFEFFPELGEKPDSFFNKKSFWWNHELLYRETLKDFVDRNYVYKKEIEIIEDSLIKKYYYEEINKDKNFFNENFKIAYDKYNEWYNWVKDRKIKKRPNFVFRVFWNGQNRKAKMDLRI